MLKVPHSQRSRVRLALAATFGICCASCRSIGAGGCGSLRSADDHWHRPAAPGRASLVTNGGAAAVAAGAARPGGKQEVIGRKRNPWGCQALGPAA